MARWINYPVEQQLCGSHRSCCWKCFRHRWRLAGKYPPMVLVPAKVCSWTPRSEDGTWLDTHFFGWAFCTDAKGLWSRYIEHKAFNKVCIPIFLYPFRNIATHPAAVLFPPSKETQGRNIKNPGLCTTSPYRPWPSCGLALHHVLHLATNFVGLASPANRLIFEMECNVKWKYDAKCNTGTRFLASDPGFPNVTLNSARIGRII